MRIGHQFVGEVGRTLSLLGGVAVVDLAILVLANSMCLRTLDLLAFGTLQFFSCFSFEISAFDVDGFGLFDHCRPPSRVCLGLVVTAKVVALAELHLDLAQLGLGHLEGVLGLEVGRSNPSLSYRGRLWFRNRLRIRRNLEELKVAHWVQPDAEEGPVLAFFLSQNLKNFLCVFEKRFSVVHSFVDKLSAKPLLFQKPRNFPG